MELSNEQLILLKGYAAEQAEDVIWGICEWADERSVPVDYKAAEFKIFFEVIRSELGPFLTEHAKAFYLDRFQKDKAS